MHWVKHSSFKSFQVGIDEKGKMITDKEGIPEIY
ncbi:MAG: hypothetical protein RLZZ198_282 [Bacteroidota bacterium]|jgi:hypothetical protein